MINNHYRLYVDKLLSLAETMTVKFEAAALAINAQIQVEFGYASVDEAHPKTWKYYQNISGQYHVSEKIIYINSLDSIDVIAFSRTSLAANRATRQAYLHGSRHYRELMLQYPDQELLIRGVLYPADIDEAIAARDGTILSYPVEMVEANEYTFISKIQAWAFAYLDRWVNPQYTLSDDLYAATCMGQFYLHLVQALFVTRLAACKTNEVHSFHVQQYLASHGMLDVYLEHLTAQQTLFLYRNVLYLQRNAGKRDTFDWLLDKLLTERGLSVYAYSATHDYTDLARTDARASNTGLLPQVAFKRKPLNAPAQKIVKLPNSLTQVLGKMTPLAVGNEVYQTYHYQQMSDALTYSSSSTLATKVLESAAVDYTDAAPYPLADILLNHWLAWASVNVYSASVLLSIPRNGTNLRIESHDAVAIFLYALHSAMSPDNTPRLTAIPAVWTQRVLRSPPPARSELSSLVDTTLLSDAELDTVYALRQERGFYKSIDAFYDQCVAIFSNAGKQYTFYATRSHYLARAQAQAAVAQLYTDAFVNLEAPDTLTGTLYAEWFAAKGLDFSDFSGQEFFDLASAIVLAATGAGSHPRSRLGEMQRAMVSLFTQLSSYSVQVLSDVNLSNIRVVPRPSLRVGYTRYQEQAFGYVDASAVRAFGYAESERVGHTLDLDKLFPLAAPTFTMHWSTRMSLCIDAAPRVQAFMQPVHLETALGYTCDQSFAQLHAALSPAQRSEMVDMYCTC